MFEAVGAVIAAVIKASVPIFRDGAAVGAPRVRVADVGGEEFQEGEPRRARRRR